jgi:2-keto-4-pentenoate hydratase/2-oxohepta-3-ene-1,7-dioic acid hydratase in catechol pathway
VFSAFGATTRAGPAAFLPLLSMTFDFSTLIAHEAKTRALSADTILSAGAVSNRDPARRSSARSSRA